MKKKIGELTLREIKDICKKHSASNFGCKGCLFEKDYVCMIKVDLESLDELGFKDFEKSLDHEIEVESNEIHKN